MGCGSSTPDDAVAPPPGDSAEQAVNKQIDNQLDQARQEEEGKVKMLLL
eukprot:CAMPEP_0197432682 /NCGR_PEP_ID=MMETSP1175-20131217/717_1 /TAXON_ID=1003142 /ORGANISM="Triceratium dubium, Strain CCMP147" /LENGTH=48 /DNA_ID= /DNA_START= /DNA_END= /DNA_ORIENTATION=